MAGFLEALRVQRWDDHRYYHHSRVNQALHLVSAVSFLCAYALMFWDPVAAALIGWLVAMTSRQIGHFFFEPKDYDVVNDASHEHKEEIKVGYNLKRKVVLMTIWALSPLPLYFDPTLFGIFEPHANAGEYIRHVALIWLVGRPRRPAVPHRPAVLPAGRADRAGLGDEDPHRPVPRHQALPQGADAVAARRVVRDAETSTTPRPRAIPDPDARRDASAQGCVSPPRPGEKRWAMISFRMRRLIDLLVVPAAVHHQPSRCIALAARTKRSATASKSASV